MTTEEMIKALSTSENKIVQRICNDIILGRDTIQHQKTVCGKFLQRVFEGRHEDAFRIADDFNKHAFIRYLLDNSREAEADKLIQNNYLTVKRS